MLELVKHFFYHPMMKGSNSIKRVLPAVIASSQHLREKYSPPIMVQIQSRVSTWRIISGSMSAWIPIRHSRSILLTWSLRNRSRFLRYWRTLTKSMKGSSDDCILQASIQRDSWGSKRVHIERSASLLRIGHYGNCHDLWVLERSYVILIEQVRSWSAVIRRFYLLLKLRALERYQACRFNVTCNCKL